MIEIYVAEIGDKRTPLSFKINCKSEPHPDLIHCSIYAPTLGCGHLSLNIYMHAHGRGFVSATTVPTSLANLRQNLNNTHTVHIRAAGIRQA